jgi:fatty-acyl-CoA synthase
VPGVLEAAVVGVPDARWGEVGCALVVTRGGTGMPEVGALLAQARERLAGYKVPRHVVFAEAIPKLGSGKIDRRAVTAQVRGTLSLSGPA